MMRKNAGIYLGKRERDGKWVEGYLFPGVGADKGKWLITVIDDTLLKSHTYAVRPDTIREFTGALDKNGKGIFEGDIVMAFKYNESPVVFPITFRAGCFWFGNWNFCEFLDKFRKIEVIGNVYDNPKLLNSRRTI